VFAEYELARQLGDLL